MEQHNYESMYSKPKKSFGKRFWELWGPVVIKYAMAYLVSAIFAGVLISAHFMTDGALDREALMAVAESQEAKMELYEIVMEESLQYLVIVDGIAAAFTIPILFFMFYRDKVKEKIAGILPNKKAKPYLYGMVIAISATMCLGLNNLILLSNLAPQDEMYQELMELMYSAPFAVQILCLGILEPVCEELVYRGLMFQRLRMQGGFKSAAIYSAIVFAVMHGNIVQTIYAFIMGLTFAYIYEKYGSVKAPILAHIAANMVSLFCTQYECFDWMMADSVRICVITVACAAVASTMYVFMQRIDETPDITAGYSEEINHGSEDNMDNPTEV